MEQAKYELLVCQQVLMTASNVLGGIPHHMAKYSDGINVFNQSSI